MKIKKRSIYDYKILTKKLKDELKLELDFFIDGLDQYHQSTYKDGKVFYCTSEGIHVRCDGYNESIIVNTGDNLKFKCNYFPINKRVKEFMFNYLRNNGFTDESVNSFLNSNIHMEYNFRIPLEMDISDSLYPSINVVLPEVRQKRVKMKGYRTFYYDKEDKNIQFFFNNRKVSMRTGKGVRKMLKVLGYDHSDEVVKRITNRLTGDTTGYKLKVVSGEDITKYYHMDYYDFANHDLGSLGSSCMREDECRDGNYFQVYEDNCSMLIFINEDTDKIIGRALLWDVYDLNDKCDVKVMDRIYSNEKDYIVFKDWALEHGYYRKRYQSYDNSWSFVDPETKYTIDKDFELNVNINDYHRLPYMDTFAWCDDSVCRNSDGFGFLSARSVSGELEGRSDEDYDGDYSF